MSETPAQKLFISQEKELSSFSRSNYSRSRFAGRPDERMIKLRTHPNKKTPRDPSVIFFPGSFPYRETTPFKNDGSKLEFCKPRLPYSRASSSVKGVCEESGTVEF